MKISEHKRRSLLKSIIWRFIGIFWTWGGAYVIIILLPEKYKTAFNIASLVTLWHHSTRMVMYYVYERIWSKINWGRTHEGVPVSPLSPGKRALWSAVVIVSVTIIFWLLFSVTPSVKADQKQFMNETPAQSTVSQD